MYCLVRPCGTVRLGRERWRRAERFCRGHPVLLIWRRFEQGQVFAKLLPLPLPRARPEGHGRRHPVPCSYWRHARARSSTADSSAFARSRAGSTPMPPSLGMNGDSGGDATDKNTATGRSRAPRSMRRITRRPAGRRMNRRGRGVAEAWPRRGRGERVGARPTRLDQQHRWQRRLYRVMHFIALCHSAPAPAVPVRPAARASASRHRASLVEHRLPAVEATASA